LLASLGAQRRVGPVDELLGACMAGDAERARRLAAARPEAVALVRGAYAGALAEAAGEGRLDAVRLLLELGVPADARAESGLTPLEAANGDREVRALLLAHGADPAKPGTPPPVERSPLDFAELSWQAEVAYLRLLAASPNAQTRPVGDGFAVRTSAESNTENGVVCDHATEDEVAEAIAWLDGAPAQWFIGRASTLGPRLVAAGATPERTAVVMGRPLDAPPPPPPHDVTVRPDRDTLGAEPVRHEVALRDGEPVGTARWMLHEDVAYGLDLEVQPTLRRQGIGGALLLHGLREAYAAGARAAVLGPTPDTIAFYRLFGFELRPYLRERSFYLP
jgi:ribosomal protein S18 acetylase RimI-like enzyme